MDIYQSEEEQVEALKKWLNENGRTIIAGIVMGILAVGGWKIWQNYEHTKALQASTVYQEMLNAWDAKKSETALQLIERLIKEHGSSNYATYGRFFKAKLKVQTGDLESAKKALEVVLKTSGDENYKHIARLRLGKILLAKNEPQAALDLLNAVPKNSGKFEAVYDELKGDAYVALNRPDDAMTEYLKARGPGENSQIINLKIDDLTKPPVEVPTSEQTAQ